MNWKMLLTGVLFLLDAFLGFGWVNSSFYYAPGIMFLAAAFTKIEKWKIVNLVTWICLAIGIIMFASGMTGISLFS